MLSSGWCGAMNPRVEFLENATREALPVVTRLVVWSSKLTNPKEGYEFPWKEPRPSDESPWNCPSMLKPLSIAFRKL